MPSSIYTALAYYLLYITVCSASTQRVHLWERHLAVTCSWEVFLLLSTKTWRACSPPRAAHHPSCLLPCVRNFVLCLFQLNSENWVQVTLRFWHNISKAVTKQDRAMSWYFSTFHLAQLQELVVTEIQKACFPYNFSKADVQFFIQDM